MPNSARVWAQNTDCGCAMLCCAAQVFGHPAGDCAKPKPPRSATAAAAGGSGSKWAGSSSAAVAQRFWQYYATKEAALRTLVTPTGECNSVLPRCPNVDMLQQQVTRCSRSCLGVRLAVLPHSSSAGACQQHITVQPQHLDKGVRNVPPDIATMCC